MTASLPDSASCGPGPADPLVGGLERSARIRGSEARLAAEAGRARGSRRYSIALVGADRGEVVETRRLELLTLSLQRRCSAG
jgi:hypothetical protein